MKRACTWFLALCLTAGILAGCGGGYSGNTAEAPSAVPAPSAPAASAPAGDWAWDSAATESMAPSGEAQVKEAGVQEAKRIYRADLWLETTAFDEAVESLGRLTKELGGYYENSSLRTGGSGYRWADYTVRVPAEKYDEFLTRAGALCNLTWRSESAENVTEAYYDTAGRLKTQQIKLERLQELLSRAEVMEDIITIESAISETEYQIESLSGTLRHYDALVDFATVTVNLQEVYKLSSVEEAPDSFAARMGSAFTGGWAAFTDGLENLAVGLAYSWTWLAVLAAVLIVVIAALRRRVRRRRTPPQEAASPEEAPPKN